MIRKQTFQAKQAGPHNTALVSAMGLDNSEGTIIRQGKNWSRHQACHRETFSIVALESFQTGTESIGYTKQEDYIKVNFWLSGRHTTVLTGYGQHEHSRPEVFLTCGPADMIKVDVLHGDTQIAVVALCLLRDFFPKNMGISPDELPEPLRAMVLPDEKPHALRSFELTPDVIAATRSILAAPFAVRRDPKYAEAKAIELMCLLMNRMTAVGDHSGLVSRYRRQESRLYEAKELIARHYSQHLTLGEIARQVGLNRMALTSGFRSLFGMTVYDCLQKERLERGFELLQDLSRTVAEIAEAVGYCHSCNFSTAFRAHFGCTPQEARARIHPN